MKVLFLSKKDDQHAERALAYIQNLDWEVLSIFGEWGEALPEEAANWEGDLIISYLSRWIVPEYLLNRATKAAINFHPAPPNYPGIGCINFALFNDEGTFGATCHHMKGKVDTGDIIKVSHFPVFEKDTIESLLNRTYDYQLILFYDVVNYFIENNRFAKSTEKWTREPYTRQEFNKLFEIKIEMSKDEVEKRIRAISYGPYQPWLELHGKKFYFNPD